MYTTIYQRNNLTVQYAYLKNRLVYRVLLGNAETHLEPDDVYEMIKAIESGDN